jgi:uncharacterized protein DUF1883/TIR domain-containing protein
VKYTHYDLGRLEHGAVVVVNLKGNAANVRLMDSSNYQSYRNGRRHRYSGGLVKRSPMRLPVPSTGHWHVTVDLLGLRGRVQSGVSVEPPALPPARSPTSTAPLSRIRHEPPPITGAEDDRQVWDVFISHASEDKASVALPLAQRLRELGVTVWLDAFELRIGDSLRRKIDAGLSGSKFGVVVLSRSFFSKGWPQYELDGLITLHVSGEQSLLPIWHEITKAEVMAQSPSLADKIARSTMQYTIDEIATEIAAVVRPDLVPGAAEAE